MRLMMDIYIFAVLLTVSILAPVLEEFQTIQPAKCIRALFTKVWGHPEKLGKLAWETAQMRQWAMQSI